MEKKYPIGGYAPGNYHCTCATCGGGFIGDKRAVQCEPCAVASLRELLKPYDQPQAEAERGIKIHEVNPDYAPAHNYAAHIENTLAGGHYASALLGYQQGRNDTLQATPQGIGWVKADTKPEYNVGVLVLIPREDNHITSGMWDISNEWVLLDEYRTPEGEVTHWMPLPGLPDGIESNDLPDDDRKDY
jgi:hypothetical protein